MTDTTTPPGLRQHGLDGVDTQQYNGVHELVAEHAAEHPERIAIVCGEDRISYGELDTLANRLAHHLVAIGVRPDSPVGVFLDRSTEFVVTVLGVLRAGGCYVPLDPHYPKARLDLMLTAVDAELVITTAELAQRLPDRKTAVALWPDIADSVAAQPSSAPDVALTPDNLTYLMFTSGSTGAPKAVGVTHRGVLRLACNTVEAQMRDTDVMLHTSSVSFDAATLEIWSALANGARLVIQPAGRNSVVEIGQLLREQEVTTAFLTAALFHLMVDERLADLRGLRRLTTGGDVVSPVRAKQFLAAFPHCALVNAYGPTEVTTITTCHRISVADAELAELPIGTPIRDTVVRILDDNLDPVQDGLPGRLYAGGAGLARGYYGDAALTAQRFIPDPFASGQRLYDTGDLAAMRPDGIVLFLGRADLQVKKRGFRVEPVEIEEALRRDPQVRDAAVVLCGETAEESVLVAFVVPISDAAQVPAEVRTRLSEHLPEYLMPDRLVPIAELPLTPNGKLDRRTLAALPLPTEAIGAAPRTELESAVSQIWCEVLSIAEVGRNDDFFALGGQSMSASRMVARIRGTIGVDVPLRVVFDHPTVAEIAELIGASVIEK